LFPGRSGTGPYNLSGPVLFGPRGRSGTGRSGTGRSGTGPYRCGSGRASPRDPIREVQH